MKEIKCTIIQDILPLYIDDVVAQDTREMVEGHLKKCGKCKKEYESMKGNLFLPAENKDLVISKLSKKWRQKKAIISLLSILATFFIVMGSFMYVFYYETLIPYSDELIRIERQDENQLVSRYFGESYAGVNETHPMSFEIDGEEKNVSFIYYTKTIADSPSGNLIDRKSDPVEKEFIFNLAEGQKIDAVYYSEFDIDRIIAGKDSWDSVLERGTLIWEK